MKLAALKARFPNRPTIKRRVNELELRLVARRGGVRRARQV